jgi:Holliday junction resolvase RusA-like endonuclease
MKFTLPLPPSLNATYRGAYRGGRLLLTEEAKAYKAQVGYALNQRDDTPLTGPCVAWLNVYMPYPRKGDHHNNTKLVLDLIQGHAYVNDSQIVSLHVERCYDKKQPRIEIEVRSR